VRHLAYLKQKFHGDLRLVAAAYYAGERVVERHGLEYSNGDVIAYVASIRARYEQEKIWSAGKCAPGSRRTR
jgi:hypothetical protein